MEYKIKSYDSWITEDFATVGVAPEGNVIGMGNVSPPSSSSNGSGDCWPSIGKPSSLMFNKSKKRKKKKKKKLDEASQSELHQDLDLGISDYILVGAARDESVSDKDWKDFAMSIYETHLEDLDAKKFRDLYSTWDYIFWLKAEYETPEIPPEWKVFFSMKDDESHGGNVATWTQTMIYRTMNQKEKTEAYEDVVNEIKRNSNLSEHEFKWLFSLLTEEDKNKYRGTASGRRFGV